MKSFSVKIPLVLKNIGFSTIANTFDRLGTALVFFLVSKQLGKDATGSYELGVTFYSMGIIFAAWGLGNLLVREVAAQKNAFSRYFSNYLLIRLIVGALTGLVVILMAVIIPNYETITRKAIVVFALCIPVSALSSLIQNSFAAFEKLKIPGIISIITTVLRVAGTYLLLLLSPDPLLKVVWFQFAVFSLVLLIYYLAMRRSLPNWNAPIEWSFILKQLAIAIPFFLYAVVMTLDNRVDVVLISLFLKEDNVATYGIMTMILGITYLIPEGIRTAVLPALARYNHSGPEVLRDKFRQMVKLSLIVTVPMAAAGVFLSRHLVNFLYKGQYAPVIRLLQITIGTVVSYTLIILFSHLLIIQKKEKVVVAMATVSVTLTILLNLLLIRPLGLEGPAIVKLVTSILLLFGLVVAVRRGGLRFSSGKDVAFILLAGLVMAAVIYLTGALWIGIRIGLGLIIYTVLLSLTRTFSIKEGLEVLGFQE